MLRKYILKTLNLFAISTFSICSSSTIPDYEKEYKYTINAESYWDIIECPYQGYILNENGDWIHGKWLLTAETLLNHFKTESTYLKQESITHPYKTRDRVEISDNPFNPPLLSRPTSQKESFTKLIDSMLSLFLYQSRYELASLGYLLTGTENQLPYISKIIDGKRMIQASSKDEMRLVAVDIFCKTYSYKTLAARSYFYKGNPLATWDYSFLRDCVPGGEDAYSIDEIRSPSMRYDDFYWKTHYLRVFGSGYDIYDVKVSCLFLDSFIGVLLCCFNPNRVLDHTIFLQNLDTVILEVNLDEVGASAVAKCFGEVSSMVRLELKLPVDKSTCYIGVVYPIKEFSAKSHLQQFRVYDKVARKRLKNPVSNDVSNDEEFFRRTNADILARIDERLKLVNSYRECASKIVQNIDAQSHDLKTILLRNYIRGLEEISLKREAKLISIDKLDRDNIQLETYDTYKHLTDHYSKVLDKSRLDSLSYHSLAYTMFMIYYQEFNPHLNEYLESYVNTLYNDVLSSHLSEEELPQISPPSAPAKVRRVELNASDAFANLNKYGQLADDITLEFPDGSMITLFEKGTDVPCHIEDEINVSPTHIALYQGIDPKSAMNKKIAEYTISGYANVISDYMFVEYSFNIDEKGKLSFAAIDNNLEDSKLKIQQIFPATIKILKK